MIPELSYPSILTPLNLDPHPFNDKQSVLLQFNPAIAGHQVLHLKQDVLKPSIQEAITSRGLEIEKVDVWRWNLDKEKQFTPHTDGKFEDNSGRKVGINWNLFEDSSGVEFYDSNVGQTVYEEVPDGRTHTLWTFPEGTDPLVIWRSRYPSLINPQAPHHVIGPAGGYRHSITIKIKGNPTFDYVQDKLWDLRIDKDFWASHITPEDELKISSIVRRLESTVDLKIPDGNLAAYNLPKDPELMAVFSKFCKKTIKNFRVFRYKSGARAHLHIDYDGNLKQFPAYALNIPLYGSNNCEINFYKNMGGLTELGDKDTGTRMVPTDNNLVYPSSTLSITTPHLIRINIPHEVYIHNNSERKVLSVRFIDTELDNPTDILSNVLAE